MSRYLKCNWEGLAIIAVMLLSLLLWTYAVSATSTTEIIIVHTGESKSLQFNPATHDEVRNEMADGNVMVSAVPKKASK